MPANTYGRQVVVPLTNKSGGGVIAGDVVYLSDGSTTDSFTTGTTSASTGGIGIAQETIANNAVGRVLVGGYAPLVNVNASVTIAHFGKSYTVAKQATDAGVSRIAGTFCLFLSGGTTPDAIIWQPDLGGGSAASFMGASAYRSTTQTISTATETPISLDTEDYDTDAIHDNSSNPSRFTVPTGGAGKWVGLAYTNWDVNSTGLRYMWWRLNGTRIRSSLVVQPANTTGQDMQNALRAVALADGDYLECAVYQDSGGNRTIGSASGDQRAAVAIWRVG